MSPFIFSRSREEDQMKKFLVLYMANSAEFEKMMKNSTPEQQKKGMEAWMKWMGDHKASLVDGGAPLGKTKRVELERSLGYEERRRGLFGRASGLGRRGDKDLRQGPPASANARRLGRNHRDHADTRECSAPRHRSQNAAATACVLVCRCRMGAGAGARLPPLYADKTSRPCVLAGGEKPCGVCLPTALLIR